MAENSYFAEVLLCFFKIIFCPTSLFILKQLDNEPSLSVSESSVPDNLTADETRISSVSRYERVIHFHVDFTTRKTE